ncbi:MAG: DNA topoisomerase 3 [Clostridiales bacterium]|nr:DNA topoisomerase 3 [Clostridiales bacterium]
MSYRLILAVKPSVAQSIAKVLNVVNKKEGYFEGNGYLVSWCIGHLIGLANAETYDEKYINWKKEDLPIIPDPWQQIVSPDKAKQFRTLKELLNRKDITEIICATDAGREGELIFRNVYYKTGCKKPFLRLWISSMEDSAILDGFEHLRSGSDYDNLYRSALARSQADWLVGINGTRLYTTLYGTLLRVGRVQTPVLSMLAERSNQIANFQKQPYWNLHLTSGTLTVHREKIFSKEEAHRLLALCQGNPLKIHSVNCEEKIMVPPRLYDLTTLQREANRYFGYTAQQVLDTVQSLYEKKLCTYPRTDSQFLTEDMESSVYSLISDCRYIFPFAAESNSFIDVKRCINNKKVSDHHALIPTAEIAKADLSLLTAPERNILEQIAMRLVCATGKKHHYQETSIIAICNGEEFTAKGKTILDNGWKETEQCFRNSHSNAKGNAEDTEPLPSVQNGQNMGNAAVQITDHFTSPPKAYTEDTLLAAMETAGNDSFDKDTEKKGLGTPATRAGILEKLVKSGYVIRKGKSLLPTQDGMNLVSIMPEELKSPAMTAKWENTLMQIERGEVSAEMFLSGIIIMVKELIAATPAPSLKEKQRFSTSEKASDFIGNCPWCGSPVLDGKSSYYCSDRNCGFCLWKKSSYLERMKCSMTRKLATELLKNGRSHMKNLFSSRTGKTFDADLLLTETVDKNGSRIASFQLDFPNSKNKSI